MMDSPNPILAELVTVMMVVCGTVSAQTFTCYNCGPYNITSEQGRSCATLSGLSASGAYQTCRTTFDNAVNPPTIERSGQTTKYPTGCTGIGAEVMTNCYCNSQNCNNREVRIPSLTCYECNTVPFLNNGCGDRKADWWSGSPYVSLKSNCHTCYKRKGADGSVQRGCSNSIYADNTCERDGVGTICYCTKQYCNSSPKTFKKSSILLSLIATIGLIKFTAF